MKAAVSNAVRISSICASSLSPQLASTELTSADICDAKRWESDVRNTGGHHVQRRSDVRKCQGQARRTESTSLPPQYAARAQRPRPCARGESLQLHTNAICAAAIVRQCGEWVRPRGDRFSRTWSTRLGSPRARVSSPVSSSRGFLIEMAGTGAAAPAVEPVLPRTCSVSNLRRHRPTTRHRSAPHGYIGGSTHAPASQAPMQKLRTA